MIQTYIPGKDDSLEASIMHFQQQLTKFGYNIEEVSFLNPVPNVWSVHIRDRDCHICSANGKGSSKKAALASALGEYIERLSTNYFFADFYLGLEIAEGEFVHHPNEKWFRVPSDDSLPDRILDESLHKFYNPFDEVCGKDLIDLQSGNLDRGICTLPFTRQSDQKTIYIPINIIDNLYASNGMSAGNTRNEARVQAMSEVLERYVKNLIISEYICLPEIPSSVMNRYPRVVESIVRLRQEGFPILSFDASLGGKYPVTCIVLFNPINGSCFASFGAHPDFGVALERTLTELLQGRSLKDLDVFSPPTFNYAQVSDISNLETHFIDSSGVISWDMFKKNSDYEFVDWSFKGNTQESCNILMKIFKRQDKEVYIADYEQLEVYTCRIIVPGISEIYPPEDLLLANNNMGSHLRKQILQLPASNLSKRNYLQIIDQLDDELIDDFTRVRELLGIATGTNNSWYTLRIGELKAMLALAGGDLKKALIWTDWTQEFNFSLFSYDRINFYRCLKDLLTLNVEGNREPKNYYYAFSLMYGSDILEKALDITVGKKRFYDLPAVDDSFKALPAHQALLQSYKKLQVAKYYSLN
ncbi:30S ribosomal protein S12 methylthiotransferase accessory factor YcaO [Candidatus Profftia tarda]|uniref:Ribosomal protein S12 methylthiotransferase accessory factor YcaO n=1 Tax=Candidatus Profftia tarda TaxID=1177216 RepID=A0A8E4H407_9ENTR|nr:30S ribosomal protein S12 methylthiotransferase accessory factor YcaO [Candidatus Profftia tarda]CAD6508822.1 Ribosomal protein S12 methylthiotransferase accessory factor YcaO [Candidatus Profftia tarda]